MVGERLSELRKDKGLTQKEMADIFGVSKNTISLYERDLMSPEDATEEAIARYFDVSLDYLHGLTDNQRSISSDNTQVIILRNVPDIAAAEITNFLNHIKGKYKLK